MTTSVKLLVLVVATVFVSSAFLSPAPAQTVSFTARVDYPVGANPSSVVVGDFNGDGVPDFATANYGANTVSVLLGNGDGTFQAARTFATAGFNPEFVGLGDVNGDGRQDLAVAHSGSKPSTVSVLRGNGDGTFQAARVFGTGPGSASVGVGDFNGDDRAGLGVANYDSNDGPVVQGDRDRTVQA